MKILTTFKLLMLIVMFPVLGNANNLGISVRMPAEFELGCGLYHGFNEEVYTNAATRLKLDANLEIEIDYELSNTPATWLSFRYDLTTTRDMFLFCHGSSDGSLVLEHYLTQDSAEEVYYSYRAIFPTSGYFALNTDRDAIFLTPTGIADLLAPGSDSDGNKLVFGCYSYISMDSWGSFGDPYAGGSFLGYPTTIGSAIACQDLVTMSEVMACEDYYYTGLENTVYSAYEATSGQCLFSGNQNNSLNPAVSCKSWDMELAAVEAWNGEIRFVVKNEERWTQYLIEGVDRIGDRPDTLAIINGYGTDGDNVFRSHAIPVEQRRHLRVIAYDNCCLETVSDWIPWSENNKSWSLKPGDELSLLPIKAMPGGGFSDGRFYDPAEKYSRDLIDPADVVVYTTTGNEPIANRIRGSWQMTRNEEGNLFRPSVYSGSKDPEAVRNLYTAVHQANQQYNAANPETPYREFPILQIVGDNTSRIIEEDTLRVGPNHFRWAEGPNGGSGDGGFSSYALMTDINGDNIPDGPVVVVPLQDYAEAQAHADAVEDYNHDPFDNGVIVALDDYYSGVAAQWLEDGAVSDFEAYSNARGLNLKGILKESDWFPSEDEDILEQMKAAGSNLINSGVSEVWFTGLAAGATSHTKFLESVPDWTTDQGFLLFGPSCNFGSVVYANGQAAIRKEMFDNPHGGIVIGGIGQLSAGYAHAHMKLSNLMQEMMSQMPEGTLVVDAAFAIQQEFLQRYPELADYGLGIHCVGSVAKLKGPSTSGVFDEPLTSLTKFGLRAFTMGTGTGIHFSLARPAEATLDIYDMRGARIASIYQGENLREGEHSATWNGKGNGRQVASGTYFAKLRAGNVSETVKFAIVK